MSGLGKTAAVIGGSMTGLACAQMLSQHFDQVVVLERDEISAGPDIHKSTPQGHHYHTLLAGGYRVFTTLFPDLPERLTAGGAVSLSAPGDACFYANGKSYNPTGDVRERRDFGIRSVSMTRGLLESTIRELAAKNPKVQLQTRTRVTDLMTGKDAVVGLNYTRNGEPTTLHTDLIIDASGRASRLPGFLESTGYGAVGETRLGVDFGYASVKLFASPDFAEPEPMHIMFGIPGVDTRGAIMARVEDGLWHLSLAGRLGDYPPGDREGFLAFAKSLDQPVLDSLIGDGATLATEIASYRYPRSQWRHYETMQQFPQGIIPLGDAVASFNPVYGQGMSSAANQIQAVEDALTAREDSGAGIEGLWKTVLPRIAETASVPWNMAANVDLQFPATVGDRPNDLALRIAFNAALGKASADDVEVHQAATEVAQLLRPPSDLMQPPYLEKISRYMT